MKTADTILQSVRMGERVICGADFIIGNLVVDVEIETPAGFYNWIEASTIGSRIQCYYQRFR